MKVDEQGPQGRTCYRSSGPGGQGSTPRTPRCGSRTLPRDSSSPARTSGRRSRTAPRRCACCGPRLLEQAQEEQRSQIAAARKSQVGTGERSERIRTYNFPQGRVTDHRIGLDRPPAAGCPRRRPRRARRPRSSRPSGPSSSSRSRHDAAWPPTAPGPTVATDPCRGVERRLGGAAGLPTARPGRRGAPGAGARARPGSVSTRPAGRVVPGPARAAFETLVARRRAARARPVPRWARRSSAGSGSRSDRACSSRAPRPRRWSIGRSPWPPGRATPSSWISAAGSGAIACALAARRPGLDGLGRRADAAAAAECARANVRRLGLEGRVQVRQGDLFAPLREAVAARCGGPRSWRTRPISQRRILPTLPVEVRDWEPPSALDGGADGLDVMRRAGRATRRRGFGGAGCSWRSARSRGPAARALVAADDGGYAEARVRRDFRGVRASARGEEALDGSPARSSRAASPLRGEVRVSAAKNAAAAAAGGVAALGRAGRARERAAAGRHRHDSDALLGGLGTEIEDRRRAHDRADADAPVRRGALRPGLDHAGVGARPRPAPGAGRPRARLDAWRVRHRVAADRPPPQGARAARRRGDARRKGYVEARAARLKGRGSSSIS